MVNLKQSPFESTDYLIVLIKSSLTLSIVQELYIALKFTETLSISIITPSLESTDDLIVLIKSSLTLSIVQELSIILIAARFKVH